MSSRGNKGGECASAVLVNTGLTDLCGFSRQTVEEVAFRGDRDHFELSLALLTVGNNDPNHKATGKARRV